MSDTFYNNDDIMQNIDSVADDVTAIKDIIINLAKDNSFSGVILESPFTSVSYTHLRAHETREDLGLRVVG